MHSNADDNFNLSYYVSILLIKIKKKIRVAQVPIEMETHNVYCMKTHLAMKKMDNLS